jgi:hypothetical protein
MAALGRLKSSARQVPRRLVFSIFLSATALSDEYTLTLPDMMRAMKSAKRSFAEALEKSWLFNRRQKIGKSVSCRQYLLR